MVGRKAAIAVGLAVALTAGCGDDGGDASSTTSTTLPPLECADPSPITSTEDLGGGVGRHFLAGTGRLHLRPLPITPDLVISGSVVLDASDLPIPADCLGRPDCSGEGGFWVGAPVPECVAKATPISPVGMRTPA